MSAHVRQPAVAGTFYPSDREELASGVDELLSDAAARTEHGPRAKAVIAPHAGHVYSGAIAATAYATLARDRSSVRRVVILGPTHRAYVRGLALAGVEAFETPLGRLEVDLEAVASIADLPQVVTSPSAHAREHSIEVHLPFVQRAFGSHVKIVPLAVGEASPEEVAEVLERLWGGDETRIVISSDLSHFLPYRDAHTVDSATARSIVALRPVRPEEACGARPVNGLLALAARRGLRIELLDLRSSGDTAGGRDEVVGYGAFAVCERVGGAP